MTFRSKDSPDNPSLFSAETSEYLADAQKRIDALPKPSLQPPWHPRRPEDTVRFTEADRKAATEAMHRHPDHSTSVEAATRVAKKLSELQTLVYGCFTSYGPMTDEELEACPEIVTRNLGKTTARRRRTDLVKLGKLFAVGVRLNAGGFKMTLWAVVPHTREKEADE